MKQQRKLSLTALVLLVVACFFSKGQVVFAEEVNFSVTGNGANSNNQVNVTSSNQTQVNQGSDATIQNNVENSANTGNNNANQNNGGQTDITTGDATTTNNVQNTGINTNSAQVSSPGTNVEGTISGNGPDSQNKIVAIGGTTTTVTQNNNATITNSVSTHANTGNNTASANNGDNVSIDTGDIHAKTTIVNKNINLAEALVNGGSCNGECSVKNSVTLKVVGNADGSQNLLVTSFFNDILVDVSNIAEIVNNSTQDLNTGNNDANHNNSGNTEIKTGDIKALTDIINENINTSSVEVTCCKEEEENPPPPPPVNPPTVNPGGGSNNPSNGVGGGEGGPGGPTGSVLGATTGEILPITGGFWMILLAIINLGIFMSGLYLRFHTGASPGIVA